MMLATKIKKKQVSNHGAYFGASLPSVALITSSYTDMTNMCISPVNPFGAGSSTLCFLHQRAGIRTHSNRMIASMKSTQTVFVMEMSSGRTSWPPTFSTILLGFACASAFLITRLKGPGRSPLASFFREFAAAEHVPACGGIHDDWQMNHYGMVSHLCDMPFIRILDMTHNISFTPMFSFADTCTGASVKSSIAIKRNCLRCFIFFNSYFVY